MAVTFNLLWRYLLRHPELHKPGINPTTLKVCDRRYTIGLIVYPIATAIGLINVPVFLTLTLALALLYLLPTPELGT